MIAIAAPAQSGSGELPLFYGTVETGHPNFDRHEAPALLTAAGQPLKAVALQAKRVLFGRLQFSHDDRQRNSDYCRRRREAWFRT